MLLSYISFDFLPHFVSYNLARGILDAHEFFAAQSTTRVISYKLQLQVLKKWNLSMKDYRLKIKGIYDTLAECGRCVSEQNQVLSIPTRLRP